MSTSTSTAPAPTKTTTTTTASPSSPSSFTPSMRDRQGRGRDPYSLTSDAAPGGHTQDEDDEDDVVIDPLGQRMRKHHETWEQKERAGFATRVLGNPDLLLWHAQARGDSVTAQRLRFTAMLCGYDDIYETRRSLGDDAAAAGGAGVGGRSGSRGGDGSPSVAGAARRRS